MLGEFRYFLVGAVTQQGNPHPVTKKVLPHSDQLELIMLFAIVSLPY